MSFTLLFGVDELIICELKAVDEGYEKNNSVSLVALAQTCIAWFIAIDFTYGLLRRQQHITCKSRQGGLGVLVAE